VLIVSLKVGVVIIITITIMEAEEEVIIRV
jgi:hypothetical protein